MSLCNAREVLIIENSSPECFLNVRDNDFVEIDLVEKEKKK